jgi:SAM-dependent methyltransferase
MLADGTAPAAVLPPDLVALLRCPATGGTLVQRGDGLASADGARHYAVNPAGIPLFAAELCSAEARVQQRHYDAVAQAYLENLTYPHTAEYMAYLDRVLLDTIDAAQLGTVAEICCGHGEAFALLGDRVGRGVGVDVSLAMLEAAARRQPGPRISFIQGDATMLPLADDSFDAVFMLGGVHHVNDRSRLFAEIHRILKPGGRFYFREPVSDFILWRWIRAVVYRLSPALDHATERPLLHRETVPVLEDSGLRCRLWQTHGFLGFCFFMNSDVLIFNRLFRFLPGIRGLTRLATRVDAWTIGLPGLARAGLQVVGVAEKPPLREQGRQDQRWPTRI